MVMQKSVSKSLLKPWHLCNQILWLIRYAIVLEEGLELNHIMENKLTLISLLQLCIKLLKKKIKKETQTQLIGPRIRMSEKVSATYKNPNLNLGVSISKTSLNRNKLTLSAISKSSVTSNNRDTAALKDNYQNTIKQELSALINQQTRFINLSAKPKQDKYNPKMKLFLLINQFPFQTGWKFVNSEANLESEVNLLKLKDLANKNELWLKKKTRHHHKAQTTCMDLLCHLLLPLLRQISFNNRVTFKIQQLSLEIKHMEVWFNHIPKQMLGQMTLVLHNPCHKILT